MGRIRATDAGSVSWPNETEPLHEPEEGSLCLPEASRQAGVPEDSYSSQPGAAQPPAQTMPPGATNLWSAPLHIRGLDAYDPAQPGAESRLFIPDYDASRAQFLKDVQAIDAQLKAAGHPGLQLTCVPIPGFAGEPTRYIDSVHIPATETHDKAVIVTTGVHGPEAAYGAAVARAYLGGLIGKVNFANTSLTIVHGINPSGWADHRRENAHGVDLNRSDLELKPGQNPDTIFQVGNEAAAKVDRFLRHHGPAGGMAAAGAELALHLGDGLITGAFTLTDLENALGYGQTVDPNDPAYGQPRPPPAEVTALNKLLEPVVAQYKDVVHLDVHSGITGNVKVQQRLTGKDRLTAGLWASVGQTGPDEAFSRAITRGKGSLLSSFDEDLPYQDVGDIPYGVQKMPRRAGGHVAALTFEQATLPTVELPLGLVARVNQYWGLANGWKSEEDKAETEKELVKAFLPEDLNWRRAATHNMAQSIDMLAPFLNDDWAFEPKSDRGGLVETLKPVPDSFKWGASVAGFQVEKGLTKKGPSQTDWGQFVLGHNLLGEPNIAHGDKADDGPDFAHLNPDGTPGGHFPEYLEKAKQMGMTSFRFSLEWSRIQHAPGAPYDPDGLRLYHAIIDACRKDGLEPIVTLQHFDLPVWAHDIQHPERGLGGWAPPHVEPGKAPLIDAFAQFAGDMAKEYGKDVKQWVTLNEPMVMDIVTYIAPVFPGHRLPLDTESARDALINMAYAHAKAYDAIHAAEPDAMVGIAQHYRRYQPEDPNSPADREAAKQWAMFANGALLDAVTRGDLDANGDGRYDGPEEGQAIPALKNRLDFVGVNYYSRDKVRAIPVPLGDKNFKLKGFPVTELPGVGKYFQTRPLTANGWEIYPEGMYTSLMEAGAYRDAKGQPLPVVVTENGIDDPKTPDTQRPAFEVENIAQVQKAMKDGVRVLGYNAWSLMSNFEWNSGFGPDFGLLHVDRSNPDRPFFMTNGGRAYAEIISSHGVTPEIAERWRNDAIDPKKIR